MSVFSLIAFWFFTGIKPSSAVFFSLDVATLFPALTYYGVLEFSCLLIALLNQYQAVNLKITDSHVNVYSMCTVWSSHRHVLKWCCSNKCLFLNCCRFLDCWVLCVQWYLSAPPHSSHRCTFFYSFRNDQKPVTHLHLGLYFQLHQFHQTQKHSLFLEKAWFSYHILYVNCKKFTLLR